MKKPVSLSFCLLCLLVLCARWGVSYAAEDKAFYELVDGARGPRAQHLVFEDLLGYRIRPGWVTESVKTVGGVTVYDAVYSIDAHSRRITPVAQPHMRHKFCLVFGCSFAFGEGVNDDETLPYYLGERLPAYMPYNYAYQGYGPQQMLALLQDGAIRRDIGEPRGMALYVLIESHINRAAGTLQIAGNWGYDMPYYTLDHGGNLVRRGSFASGRRFVTALYRRIIANRWLNRLLARRDFPPVTDRDVYLTCRIIGASRDEFRQQFKSDDFYVVIFSGGRHVSTLTAYLRAMGIKYLDYHDRPEFGRAEYRIKNDNHPAPVAYKLLADCIARDLALRNMGTGRNP
jgi:hypothetical protein